MNKLQDIEIPQVQAAEGIGKSILVIIGIIAAVAVGYYAYTQIQNQIASFNPLSFLGIGPQQQACVFQQTYQNSLSYFNQQQTAPFTCNVSPYSKQVFSGCCITFSCTSGVFPLAY